MIHWCARTQLSIIPQKMVIAQFAQKRDLTDLQKPTVWTHIVTDYRGYIVVVVLAVAVVVVVVVIIIIIIIMDVSCHRHFFLVLLLNQQ